ncbi:hypothetical protein EOD41_04695 [Mucilaginibacter limnophilus]|uniref:Uncharacterized protein n=1 Tax=Mucilaginibacter limnophilus TaxID=1932778 RepID=A0A3S2Y1H5_9SPHI|nr:hypothetical protein [Mucilaginibacter limnophilus]RVU01269.1 hypothetical protein EOD41_04695 [Mucilaginibacter limnophilus]
MKLTEENNTDNSIRVVKTARNKEAINEAAAQGFWPLVKPVIPSPNIKSKFAVLQDKETGKINVVNDYRQLPITLNMPGNHPPPVASNAVIDWTFYYPYQFESPFAAYLIPHDIQVGETVFLEDLIEDVVGISWKQGDAYRLKSCKAVWDGRKFVLQHEPSKEVCVVG